MKKGVILAVVTGAASDPEVLDATLALSRIYDSHIEVLHPRLDPFQILAGLIDGINGLGTSDIVAGITEDINRRHQLAKSSFSAWMGRHNIRLETEISKSFTGRNNGLTTTWRQCEGTYDGAMIQYGRLADVIVLAQPGSGGHQAQQMIVEAALFETGRPVMCIPAGFRGLDPKRVAIFWNGSQQAARAVGDAMPLLSACGNAVVMSAGRSEGSDATDLVERLVLRGIEARTKRINSSQEKTPAALLAALEEISFGLVVMGGYGHCRLREMFLGGVTRHMLAEAKIPVLLAY
ncbi:MAG: universal stress protein [Rhodospirillaceae bacterium]|nr:universal stress protein [Rhodospirillaceae bacterium]